MDAHLLKPLAPADLEAALVRGFEARGPITEDVAAEPADEACVRQDLVATFGPNQALQFARMALGQLEARFERDDRAMIAEDAHGIAGSAGLVGLNRVGAAARDLEARCAAGQPIDAQLALARAALAQGRQALETWIGTLERAAAA